MAAWISLLLLLQLSLARSSQSNAELEDRIAASYTDKGKVRSKTLQLDGGNSRPLSIHYLASGPEASASQKAPVVIFCHGAAFTSETWKVVGTLDELGAQGFTVLAPDLPGYGSSEGLRVKRLATSGQIEVDRSTFLRAFLAGLGVNDRSSQVVVVSASMGGSFALPFVMDPGPFKVVGYVTVAGSLATPDRGSPASLLRQGGAAGWVSTPRNIPPALVIFGSEDPRLRTDRARYESLFPRNDVVVIADAPHPAYLRDRAAADLFTDLVLSFVGGGRVQSTQAKVDRLQAGVKVEARYNYGETVEYYPGTITRVNSDGTYDIAFDDGDAPTKQGQNSVQQRKHNGNSRRGPHEEMRVPPELVRSLEYNGPTTLSAQSEVLPALKVHALWSRH